LRLHQELGEPNRHGCDTEFLRRPGVAAVRGPLGERRYPRVLEHHTHNEAIQAHAPFLGPEDPDTDLSRVGERAHVAGVLPRPRHRYLR